MEYWKIHPSYPLLRVSNQGRFMTLPRNTVRRNGRDYHSKGRFIKVHLHRDGMSAYIASKVVGDIAKLAGRLVLETFVGPCPEGMECCHDDGDPLNNTLTNLRWDTHKNNEMDKHRHGTNQEATNVRGADHPLSKLTEDDVRNIRSMYIPYKFGITKIAAIYGVTNQSIHAIVTKKSWKHV